MQQSPADAFETYRLQSETRRFIKDFDAKECVAMLRLMAMEGVKVIAGELGFGIHSIYALRKNMEHFVVSSALPDRFAVLHRELCRRRELFS